MKQLLLWSPALLGLLGCESIVGVTERTFRTDTEDDAGVDSGRPPTTPLCEDYCQEVMRNCIGLGDDGNLIYDSQAQCEAVCTEANWEDGNEDDGLEVDGGVKRANTLRCRLNQAVLARDQLEVPYSECANASPLGGGVCVGDPERGPCENYCDLLVEICPSPYRETLPLEERRELCRNDCQALEVIQGDVVDGDYNITRDVTGDTLQCRVVQLGLAAEDLEEDSVYCPPARVTPLQIRGTNVFPCRSIDADDPELDPPECKDYCRVMQVACVEDQAVYETPAQCVDACRAMDDGTRLDYYQDSPNTVGCRLSHAYNVLASGVEDRVGEREQHCPHAGPGGGTVCPQQGADDPGTGCIGYCDQLEAYCPDAYSREFMGDEETCILACDRVFRSEGLAEYAWQTAENDQGLGCRLLHAIRAAAPDIDTEEMCAIASDLEGGACAADGGVP